MSQQELLIKTVHFLNNTGIDYMVTGSVVSSLQGEPRSTHDIDFVVTISPEQVDMLADAYPEPKFYLDTDAAVEAINKSSMFNVIDTDTGDKVDFWMLTPDPFDTSRFSRKIDQGFGGITLKVPTPEDTILMKLKWAKMSGGSEKQVNDAIGVYEVQFGKLDRNYIEKWVAALGLADLWTTVVDRAETI